MGKLAWLLLLTPTVSAQTITSFETEDWPSVIRPGGVRAERVQENASDGESCMNYITVAREGKLMD